MMKRWFSWIVIILLPYCSITAQTLTEIKNLKEYGEGSANKDHEVLFRNRKATKSDLFGSGGMNYRYNTWTGLYNGLRNMRKDLFGIWIDGSYSGLYNNVSTANTLPGGGSLSFGLTYEYDHYGKVIVQTGVSIRAQRVYNEVSDVLVVNENVVDKMGYKYTLFTDYHERHDCSDMIYMQIPLLVGSYYGPFYYMGGLKLQVAHWGQTSTHMLGTTTGVYEQYSGLGPGSIFQEMDNHGLQQRVPISRSGMPALDFKWDILLSAEIGYEIAQRDGAHILSMRGICDTRVRFALFLDWGMLNINPNSENLYYEIPEYYQWDFPEHNFAHILSSTETQGAHVHNFFTGLKITLLFGVPWQQVCRICHPYHSELEYR